MDLWRVDIRPEVRVLSGNIDTCDEAACTDAFHALAKATKEGTKEFSINSYREFAVLLPSIKLTYEEFTTWCTKRGFSIPTFWKPRDQVHRHHAGAASSGDSGLGRVAPKKERKKTWLAKRGKRLTVSEIEVVRVMNELWPDGRLDLRAKARDKRIEDQLGHRLSPRTIQRTLEKIHFD